VKVHNSNVVIVSDWIELSTLLYDSDDGITITECVGYFIEQQIYDDQDFCRAFFESVFAELSARQKVRRFEYPISMDDNKRLTSAPWTDNPALAFCLLISVAPHYSGYTEWAGPNYIEQGSLFEKLTEDAMRIWFPGWDVHRTGWEGGVGTDINHLLNDLADLTSEAVRSESASVLSGDENDLGVDFAVIRNFPDQRASLPVIFGQCASGRDWSSKIHTPDTSRWKQLLTLTHSPLKAFSLPFRLPDDSYAARRSQYQGLLLDRLRLLPRGYETDWLREEVRADLVKWISPRREWLIENFDANVA
jgi:hypothetical protein